MIVPEKAPLHRAVHLRTPVPASSTNVGADSPSRLSATHDV
jgi:hypothetical protein